MSGILSSLVEKKSKKNLEVKFYKANEKKRGCSFSAFSKTSNKQHFISTDCRKGEKSKPLTNSKSAITFFSVCLVV